ncbi:recombinase family protein [Nesterenkonia salmonea]|uniref:Recombinase family protein n=1 Tax=Nesterenkonia salmonea TaxID=1804987 RepID=A0A5R9BBK4_9MICC|nr:recombinase family protein [Nesterenkonia salmonea]TLP95185.1 recombinase family protein [Nesterenkonia salmonea]
MRAFIYTRNASPSSEERDWQYEQCKTAAEEHHYEVIGTAHDNGHERSGLATLIEQLRTRDIDIVFTTDHATLGPTISALAAMVDEIHRNGAQLLTCAEPPLPASVTKMLVKFAQGHLDTPH